MHPGRRIVLVGAWKLGNGVCHTTHGCLRSPGIASPNPNNDASLSLLHGFVPSPRLLSVLSVAPNKKSKEDDDCPTDAMKCNYCMILAIIYLNEPERAGTMQARKQQTRSQGEQTKNRRETTTPWRTSSARPRGDLRVVAGAHALLPLAAAVLGLLVLAAGAAFRAVLRRRRSVRGSLRAVRVERGEDPHVALPSATAAAAIVAGARRLAEPQLLPAGEQRHRRGEVHEM